MLPLLRACGSFCVATAPDLPGYGQSDKPKQVLSLSELADSLSAWMDAAELARAHFLGNSFGCQVLVQFAVKYPDRVDRLVLQGPTIEPGARTLRQQFFRLLKNSRRESPGLGWIMLTDYWRAGLRRVATTIRLALQDRIEEKLPSVQAPTLVVRGSRDPLVSQHWAEQVVRLLPHGALVVIPGLAHTINYTHPGELLGAVRPFLSIHDQNRLNP
jgi:pimeloyl-ACP methyl ester carboxylesterase